MQLPPPSAQSELRSELSALCQSCGLCCDGSLFGRVDLEPGEVERAHRHHLRVVASGKSFEQPCGAFAGERCTIYEERPASCRRFVCRLHEKHRLEGGPLEEALSVVRRARSLLTSLDGADGGEARAELGALLEESFARA
jgi:hypothetical protein